MQEKNSKHQQYFSATVYNRMMKAQHANTIHW